jgi:hypothetical protein
VFEGWPVGLLGGSAVDGGVGSAGGARWGQYRCPLRNALLKRRPRPVLDDPRRPATSESAAGPFCPQSDAPRTAPTIDGQDLRAIDVNMVQERGEPRIPIRCCHSAHTTKRTERALPGTGVAFRCFRSRRHPKQATFRVSIAGLRAPLSTLRCALTERQRMTRGHRDSLRS